MKKKLIILCMVGFISTSMFAKQWYYHCPGGGTVYFSTSNDTTSAQASAMGQAWCDNR